MRSEMRTWKKTRFTYLHKIFKSSRLNPTKLGRKGVSESRLIINSSERIYLKSTKNNETLMRLRIGASER